MMKRNTEFRTWKTCPYIEVNRDGEVRYQKGKEQYRGGSLIRPEEFIKNSKNEPRPIQWMIFKAFPDIPLLSAPKSWKEDD
jgi:hypothetical protein